MISPIKLKNVILIVLLVIFVRVCYLVMNKFDSEIEEKQAAPKTTLPIQQSNEQNQKEKDTQNDSDNSKKYIPLSFDDVKANYDLHRNRPTPIRFKKWYDFAVENQCNLDEDIYSKIYKDLAPFFAMSSKEFNHRLSFFEPVDYFEKSQIKNGKIIPNTKPLHGDHLIQRVISNLILIEY